jgi:hypothetical protein
VKCDHIKLEKGVLRFECADEVFLIDVAVNWPFHGWRYYEWSPHRCGCGNTRFFVTQCQVPFPPPEDAPPDPVQRYRPEYRIVCPGCIKFLKAECILGEIEFSDMSVYVYHFPEPAPEPDADRVRTAIDGYIPRSLDRNREDGFNLKWFDSTVYPEVFEPDTHVYREYLRPMKKEKKKPWQKHVTSTFEGFDDGEGDGPDRKRRLDPADEAARGKSRRVQKGRGPVRKAK